MRTKLKEKSIEKVVGAVPKSNIEENTVAELRLEEKNKEDIQKLKNDEDESCATSNSEGINLEALIIISLAMLIIYSLKAARSPLL